MPPKRATPSTVASTREPRPRRAAAAAAASQASNAAPKAKFDKPKAKPAGKKRKLKEGSETATEEPARKRKSTTIPAKKEPKAKADAKAKPTAAKKAKGKAAAATAERDESETCFWLMKAEPETRMEKGVDVKFSIDDLRERQEPEAWDGVRNPLAQKNMRNMRANELAFFYHSNCKVPGIAGVMRIVREASTDEAAFDPKHPYYDPKSDRNNPRWIVVHVEFVKKFDNFVSLKTLQEHAKSGGPLEDLQTLRGARLSVSHVRPEEWDSILGLAGVKQEELDELVSKR